MQKDKKLILKVLIGSRAHGLHNLDSDMDYRGVYVYPTQDILSLDYVYKGSSWIHGKEDQTLYELGHFLHLAMKCNPTILEIFMAPVEEADVIGKALQDLFPYVWNPADAFNAFTGYSKNQQKKMLDKKDGRERKFAVAYLRTLWNLYDLLTTGRFSLEVTDQDFKQELLDIKYGSGKLDAGYIINRAEELEERARTVLPMCLHKPDQKKVNDFLLYVRKEYWK